MSLRLSYTLIAPFYDAVISSATRAARARSLAALAGLAPSRILVSGVGTGLDLPLLPPGHRYTGLDLTAAMLQQALPRARGLDFQPVVGDAQRLPFPDGSFDHAVLHLILAVVPEPSRCLAETARVVRPGGQILVFDKFLRRGQTAPLRRLVNPLVRRVATRLDVCFDEVLADVAGLAVVENGSAGAGGWFRRIRLVRT